MVLVSSLVQERCLAPKNANNASFSWQSSIAPRPTSPKENGDVGILRFGVKCRSKPRGLYTKIAYI